MSRKLTPEEINNLKTRFKNLQQTAEEIRKITSSSLWFPVKPTISPSHVSLSGQEEGTDTPDEIKNVTTSKNP